MVRSSSGDVDIIVFHAHYFFGCDVKVYIDIGLGTHRKLFHISFFRLPTKQRNVLLGIHLFTGKDYLSSFFKKKKTLKMLYQNREKPQFHHWVFIPWY